MTPPAGIYLWTVYDRQVSITDYAPGRLPNTMLRYVALRFHVTAHGQRPVDALLAARLQQIDAHMIERGYTKLPRTADDAPQIVSTWME